jgi:hypothetical protein
MSCYRPDEIDPNTITVQGDYPHLRDLLGGSIREASVQAKRQKAFFRIGYEERDGGPGIILQEIPHAVFNDALYQCPRAFDIDEPSPLPTVLVTPEGDAVVSKPSLCDGCVHRLERGVTGNCYMRRFEALKEIKA